MQSALEVLSAKECWELLSTRRVGRLAFTDRALPTIRPLNYTLVGHRIMLRLAGHDLGARLDGQVVAFEVDETDSAAHEGWSVVVTGTVSLTRAPSELTRAASVPASWAGQGHQDAACITVGELTGRRLRGVQDDLMGELKSIAPDL